MCVNSHFYAPLHVRNYPTIKWKKTEKIILYFACVNILLIIGFRIFICHFNRISFCLFEHLFACNEFFRFGHCLSSVLYIFHFFSLFLLFFFCFCVLHFNLGCYWLAIECFNSSKQLNLFRTKKEKNKNIERKTKKKKEMPLLFGMYVRYKADEWHVLLFIELKAD